MSWYLAHLLLGLNGNVPEFFLENKGFNPNSIGVKYSLIECGVWGGGGKIPHVSDLA